MRKQPSDDITLPVQNSKPMPGTRAAYASRVTCPDCKDTHGPSQECATVDQPQLVFPHARVKGE
jgi:hypothetical protein